MLTQKTFCSRVCRSLTLISAVLCAVFANTVVGEQRTSRITIEEVDSLSRRSSEQAAKLAVEWVERGRFSTNFDWQAAMLFLRRLPDMVSSNTLSNILDKIGDDGCMAAFSRCAEDRKTYPDYSKFYEGAYPFRSLVTIAMCRLKHANVTNAIAEMVATLDATAVGGRRLKVIDGFMQTEIVFTMLAYGIDVPKRFRSSPEYVRHQVLRESSSMTVKDIMVKGSSAIWVPKRDLRSENLPDDLVAREDAERALRQQITRKIFESVAWQSVLLQESKRLVAEGRRFIENHDEVKDDKGSMGLAVQMVWAYIIVARHASEEEAKTLLRRVEKSLGKDRVARILKMHEGALDTSADLWWYKKGVYPSGQDPTFFLIYDYVFDHHE